VQVDTLVGVCALAAPATVALVLVLEAGLLIGIVLPAGSMVLGLGVLAGAGVVTLPLAALTVAPATVLGAALGHHAARRRSYRGSPGGGGQGRRLPARAALLTDRVTTPWREAIGRRPVRAAATAQFVVGGRTLAPRLAATAGVPLTTMLCGTAPAALVWSSALIATGALAGAALPLIRDLLMVAGIPLAMAVVAWLLVSCRTRRGTARRAGSPA
jgi:membrane protein DedA with SNARE-associated domain